jgi:signal transduction histidine kinase
MTLKTKIVLFTVVLVTLLVGALSALLLDNLVKSNLQNSVRLAELAAQQTKELLLWRLEESGKGRAAWFETVAEDQRLGSFLENTVAQGPSLIEVSIARDDGRVLLSSTRTSAGSRMRARQALRDLLAAGPLDRIRGVYTQGMDYELRIPIGLLEDPRPIFTIQVLVSTVLIQDALRPGVQWIGTASLLALLASLVLVTILAGFVSRNLKRIDEGIDLIRHGENVPEASGYASSPEFAAVQSKLSLLGAEVRDTARTAADFRSRVSAVLERLEEGILLFDSEQHLILSGGASERLLGRRLEGLQADTSPLSPLLREAVEQRRSLPERPMEIPVEGSMVSLLVAVDLFADGRALVRVRDPEGRKQLESQIGLLSRLDSINRLTGGVAHEIKNPLNSIAARLALLESIIGGESEEAEAEIRVIEQEVERLDRVVRTFLDFTRPVELAKREFSLPELVSEVASLVEPDAARRKMSVACQAESAEMLCFGDPDLLRQALMNLAVNALEAMGEGGSLKFEARGGRTDAQLCVSDTGPGIPEAQRDRIFQLYYTTKKGGSGLGLAMVYRAVQLHGGSIEVESVMGQGTTFRIVLPLLEKT